MVRKEAVKFLRQPHLTKHMSRSKTIGSILILSLIMVLGCHSQNKLSAELLEINFIGEFSSEHWIEIDGIRLIHQSNFERDSLMLAPFFPEIDQPLPTTIQHFRSYTNHEAVNERKIPKGRVAESFFTRMSLAYRLENGKRKRAYVFEGNVAEMSMGKLRFYRTDGRTMTIRTSKNYPALIKNLNNREPMATGERN